jgi:hypothetical protein
MNRRERRAQWLAHHRGEAGAPRAPRRESLPTGHAARAAHDQRAGRVEGRAALRVESPVAGPVRLHIEEVVLHGFNPRERYTIGDSVQQELTRLMTDRGVPSLLDAPRSAERLDPGTFHVTPNSRPPALGAQVARAVYGGLKR